MEMKFPSIKREIANLIEDQEGNITRGKMLSIGTMVILLGILLSTDIFAGHRSHSSHSSHKSHSSTSYHRSHVSHTSHSSASHSNSHSSHASHANTHSSHASHANTHSSHASQAAGTGNTYSVSDNTGDVSSASALAVGASVLGGGIAIHKIKKAKEEKKSTQKHSKTAETAAAQTKTGQNVNFVSPPEKPKPSPKSNYAKTIKSDYTPKPPTNQSKMKEVPEETRFSKPITTPLPAPASSKRSKALEAYVLSALKDGKWHRLKEILAQIPETEGTISIQRIAAICNRLKEKGALEKKKESNAVFFRLRRR